MTQNHNENAKENTHTLVYVISLSTRGGLEARIRDGAVDNALESSMVQWIQSSKVTF